MRSGKIIVPSGKKDCKAMGVVNDSVELSVENAFMNGINAFTRKVASCWCRIPSARGKTDRRTKRKPEKIANVRMQLLY
jgi:hypothetical protein